VKYFLVVFDRRRRLLEEVQEFADSDVAVRARFEREAHLHGQSDIEVVVLGAASREALENTHSRYFGSVRELTQA
jgi:hypothetical protein